MLNDGENLLPPSVHITDDSMIRNIDDVEHPAPAPRAPASFFCHISNQHKEYNNDDGDDTTLEDN